MKKFGFIFFLCGSFLWVNAGVEDSSRVRYRMPIEIPISLSGTFGEIRGSHFHAGIDIRTNGREGYPVYAIESGFVSRIKISATGYGNAIYIDHPSTGHTSVYAHMRQFNDRIQRVVREMQYNRESFEIDQYFDPQQILIEKDEVIGQSGNSGGSFAPHLHFEIRDRASQVPLNPLAFLDVVKDDVAPVMHELYIYPMSESRGRYFALSEGLVKYNGVYKLNEDTLKIGFKTAAFGINVLDLMNGNPNKNGVYELLMQVDGKTVYRFSMNAISFNHMRYVQAHMDFMASEISNEKVHRCFLLPGNPLTIYDSVMNAGIISFEKNQTRTVTIAAKDFNKNVSTLVFHVRHDPSLPPPDFSTLEYDTIFGHKKDNLFTADEFKIFIPKNTFYDSVYFNYEKVSDVIAGKTFSAVHRVHHEWEAAHQNFTLYIKAEALPENLKDKALIVREYKKKLEPSRSSWDGNFLYANTRDFGKYFVTVDTLPPKITPVNISANKNVAAQANIKIKIEDDLSGLKSYRGELNGKWILTEYDEKNDLLTYNFDERMRPGKNIFVVRVEDEVGNFSSYEVSFVR